jgi:LmbE family N-acetylglucosaminyl deacetylase/protein-L-isoaspartate O-methyltransferase
VVTFDASRPGTSRADWAADARWAGLPHLSLDDVTRLIVVAAHPDDETLGAGGLMAECFGRGIPVSVIVVTNGDASHPNSPTHDPASIARRRSAELHDAVELLAPGSPVFELGFADGMIASNTDSIRVALASAVSAEHRARATRETSGGASEFHPRTRTLLAAPWRGDGHRDHRVLGELCAELAVARGFELLEYPIWLWHWATPATSETPWADFVSLPLGEWAAASKDRAISVHRSQVAPLSPAEGDEPVLHASFLANFDRDDEIFVVASPAAPASAPQAAAETATPAPAPTVSTPAPAPVRAVSTPAPAPVVAALPAHYFDETYARHDDPWGFTSRWYEERKRAVTVAALPRARYTSAFEIGCSIGVLTAELAPRCDTLLSVDIAPAAVEQARRRLADQPHVTIAVDDVSRSFPPGPFDLIVLSEVGYYFAPAVLANVLDAATAALATAGHFVACHWRHTVGDYLQTGDAVHEQLARHATQVGWTRLVTHVEDDFVLDVYSPDPRSVAAETGLL